MRSNLTEQAQNHCKNIFYLLDEEEEGGEGEGDHGDEVEEEEGNLKKKM